MKIIILVSTIFFTSVPAYSQKTTTTKPISTGTIIINVPNFADPAIKRFYDGYTVYLKKAVMAVRSKDEAACRKFFKEPIEIEDLRQQNIQIKAHPG